MKPSIKEKLSEAAKLILVTVILFFIIYEGLVYFRHRAQIHFANIHSLLNGEEYDNETFSDPLWQILGEAKVKLDQSRGSYSITHTMEIEELVGKEVTVKGFMLPLEPAEKFHHFLLSKKTPTCAFCPPGEPNEVIDVWIKDSTKWNENLITVKGKFYLMNDKESGLFFKIDKAEVQ